MEEQVIDPIIFSIAQDFHVFPQYVLLALQAWDYTDNNHQQHVCGQNNNYFFFAVPWLVTARGNQLRPEDITKNREIFRDYNGILRFEGPKGARSIPILNVRFDDVLGEPVRGIVSEGNHRINEFNRHQYSWFPITVFNNRYEERGLVIPYSETKKHQYRSRHPSYPDPKWTIASTANVERIDGPVLLNIRAVYDRLKLENMENFNTKKKKKKKKKPKRRKMQTRCLKRERRRRRSEDDDNNNNNNNNQKREQKKRLVGFGLGSDEEQEFWIPVCSTCDNYYRTGVACDTCVNVAYCSERCRDIHWNAGHDEVCELALTDKK